MIKHYLNYSILFTSILINCAVYAQECAEAKSSVTPDSRYQLLNAGQEVKDLKTGLIWQRCLAGEQWNGRQCTGEFEYFSYTGSQAFIAQHAKGWRLPTIQELSTLSSGCWGLAINTNAFPPNPERYSKSDELRSSSQFKPTPQEAADLKYFGYDKMEWYMTYETNFGQTTYKTHDLQMRLVRR
jgi:hypothetical protein